MDALLLLGPTGAGKTPLGKLLEDRGLGDARFCHFDFGENLRTIVASSLPDGWATAAEIDFLRDVLASGALLEDTHFPLAKRILQGFLAQKSLADDTILVLNGLPRHVGQATAISDMLRVRGVVVLECTAATVLARLASNVGGDRGSRNDDDLAAVVAKLDVFSRRTAPLVEYYQAGGAKILRLNVTVSMTPEEMWHTLEILAGGRLGGT